MDLVALVLTVAAYLAAIVVPLVLLPLALERRLGLPYNSVRSRLLAWSVFVALMLTVSVASPTIVATWDAGTWAGFAVFIAAAVAWDLYDMKTRRIPRGHHPTR